MKKDFSSSEEKADMALESLDGIAHAEIPEGLEDKMLARFDSEFSVRKKTPKWFWVAAIVLLMINITAVYKYSFSTDSPKPNPAFSDMNSSVQQNEIGNYYFNGGSSWF